MAREHTSDAFAAFFDDVYQKHARPSLTIQRIWREVYGDEYPQEVDPFSFTTMAELRRIAHELRVGRGQSFADLGCGRGGPGMWVARETGAALLGIDISSVAVSQAMARIPAFGLEGRARFEVGNFLATGIESVTVDAVMSIDAIHFAPDKVAALQEVIRILRPGGRFVYTTADFWRTPPNRPPQVADQRPLLEAAGFIVEAYEETADWKTRSRAVFMRMRDAYDALVAEQGVEGAEDTVNGAIEQLAIVDDMRRRVLVVAYKT